MTTFTWLAWLTGGTLGLNVLGVCTAYATDCFHTTLRAQRARQPAPPRCDAPTPVAVEAADEATAGYWWRRVFTIGGVLGLLMALPQGWILLINSNLIAITFETILDRPGLPLLPLNIYGWEREITDFDLMGALISVAQMITGSVLYHTWREEHQRWPVLALALIALPCLVGFEVGASVYRGWIVTGDVYNAGLSGLLASGIATSEVIMGIFVIDRFLAPVLLAIVWTVATPVHALAQWWARRRAARQARPPSAHTTVLIALLPLVALDQAVMAPLRSLDRLVASLVPERFHRSPQAGGSQHATPLTPADLAQSRNGDDPGRLRGDLHRPAQTPDPVDHRA